MAEVEEIICNVREDLLDYDLPLHIASIFILVGVSLLGSLSPVLYSIYGPSSKGSQHYDSNAKFMLRLGLLFGAGIILSTAFIHMFVPAVLLLTDPCLSAAFTEDYEAFAGM
jgi:zinc transporter 1/2/3